MKKKYHNAVQELLAQNPTRTFKPKELARKIGPGYSLVTKLCFVTLLEAKLPFRRAGKKQRFFDTSKAFPSRSLGRR